MARISIEDCQKVMPNRFALVVVAANRTRQLMGNCTPLVASKNKHAVTALREIAEEKVLSSGEGEGHEQEAAKDTIEALLPSQGLT
ncbi:MAG: DNA-directed RNA polymerase subunit omega [Zetaproteobacteria bacterium]|nr:DNA-directed RNA polymerase subunit omega [Zetaproteobacteria bacterium]